MKSLAKSTLRTISYLIVLPAIAMFRMQAAMMGQDQAFPGWSQLFSLLPGISGEYLRYAFYRATTGLCGDGACISFGTVAADAGIRIGRSVGLHRPFLFTGQCDN